MLQSSSHHASPMQKEWARVARVTPAGARLRVDTTTPTSSIRSWCLKDYSYSPSFLMDFEKKNPSRSNFIQLSKILAISCTFD